MVDDTKVSVVIDATSCTTEDAVKALTATGGDVNAAIDLVNRIARNYIAIKVWAQGRRSVKINFLLFVLANGVTGEVKKINAFATYDAVSKDTISVDADWQSFCKTIDFLRGELIPEYGLEGRFNNYLWKTLSPSLVNRFYRCAREKECTYIKEFFSDSIRKSTEEEVVVELGVQLVSAEELKRSTEQPSEKKGEEEPETEAKKDAGELFLSCMPVIEPVGGVSIDDLQPGERVFVRLVDNTPLGTVIKQFFPNNPVDEDGNPIIMVPVRKITATQTGRREVYVEIGRGILGRFLMNEALKVRVYREEGTKVKLPKDYSYLVNIAILVVLVLIVVIVLFYVFGK